MYGDIYCTEYIFHMFLSYLRYMSRKLLKADLSPEPFDLRRPKLLQVDPGREYIGAVNRLLAKHDVKIRRGRVDIHRG